MTADPARGRLKAALDASSAILLFKTGLFEVTARRYGIIMAASAYAEITRGDYPGSVDFSSLAALRVFEILDPRGGECEDVFPAGLGPGETGSMSLYLEARADFVILDDRGGAAECRRRGIPFVNALLVPRLLHFYGDLDEPASAVKFNELSTLGRYSGRVVTRARGFGRGELARFL
jgi:predicted nucleic acid-binding protein